MDLETFKRKYKRTGSEYCRTNDAVYYSIGREAHDPFKGSAAYPILISPNTTLRDIEAYAQWFKGYDQGEVKEDLMALHKTCFPKGS